VSLPGDSSGSPLLLVEAIQYQAAYTVDVYCVEEQFDLRHRGNCTTVALLPRSKKCGLLARFSDYFDLEAARFQGEAAAELRWSADCPFS